MQESPQKRYPDPSNRDTSKDHHTNLIPVPSIKHPISFAFSYKNVSNIIVEKRQQYFVSTE